MLRMEQESQLVIIGGGPAGIAAAIAAARNGVKVLLIERYGFLGGNAITGLCLHTFHTREGKRIIGGIPWKIINRLVERGGSLGPIEVKNSHMATTTPIDAEVFKYETMEMIREAGARLLLHSYFVDVVREDNKIKGVVVVNKSGQQVILSDLVIDASGDGDVAYAAGAPYQKGRPEDGLMQTMSLIFKMGNVDIQKVVAQLGIGKAIGIKRGEKEPSPVWFSANFSALSEEVIKEGPFSKTYQFWGNSIRSKELNINATRIIQLDGTKAEDLTHAEIEARRHVMTMVKWLQKYVPGFEKSYLISTAHQIGIRETRRIMGEYILTEEDVLEGRKFNDVIARGSYPLDIHDPQGKGTTFAYVKGDGSYDIPYRCLVPRKIDNLLVTGRCISTTHKALASTRVMVICMALGEAAGTAAALAIKENVTPRELDVSVLQKMLIAQGADLGRA